MLTTFRAGPPKSKPWRRMRRLLVLAAWICGAPMTGFIAVAQNALTVDTPALGMTGWRSGPVTVDTAVLGMTGWRTDPVVVVTPVLGMTGWRTERPPLEVLSGNLELRDPGGPTCPRRAEAALSLRTNVAGPVLYSLDCTGGRSWSQTATAHETAPNTYLAVAVLPFDIKHKEQVNCALKSRLQSPPKIVAVRGHAYDCAKSGPDRIVTPPPTGVPPRPGVMVDPPRPACVGGRLLVKGTKAARYTCQCPAGQTALGTGPNSYRCQGKTVAGITCTGGTIRNGQCICPSNVEKAPSGANAWRCQRRGASAGPKSRPR